MDNTAPTGTVTAPAAGANVRGTIALTSNSADAGGSGVATVQFQRSPAGAGTWTNQGASFDTTAVADGQYDLRVTTTDNAGNTFTSAAITIRVDNTLPTGTVTAPAAGANVRGTIALTSNSADAGGSGVATVQFQRSPAGAGTWTNQGASFDTTAVADGQYDLRVTTTDNAGNTFTSAAITIRVDNTLPTGTVTAPANGAEIGVAPVTLTSNSADAGGSGVATVVFERSPAGAGTWTATAASWNTASGPDAVADGSYDLRVKTTDNAGNVFTSAAITVLVDHTAPTTSASLAPASPSNAPVTVSFSASDGTGSGVSVISYRIDGGSLQQGAAVVVPAPGDHSNDGAHLVEYFATDEVGNVESLKSVTVVIDTTAPSGSGGDPGDYLRGIANLSYSTAAGDVSSVQFQFSPAGAGAWTNVGAADIAPPYEASWNTTLVADGPYDLRAVVTDATGNVANTLLPGLPKTVDNTAPSGSVTAPVVGRLRLRLDRGRRERERRRRSARVRRLGRPLRGQAVRRRRLQRLRHADGARRRLDLPPDPGDDGARRRSCRPARRRHRRRRQRDDLGREHDQRRQRRARGHARTIPAAAVGRERRPDGVVLGRHRRRHLPLPPRRQRSARAPPSARTPRRRSASPGRPRPPPSSSGS